MADDTSTDTAPTDDAQESATDTPETAPATLGDAGKAALDKERATARAATKAQKDAERALAAANADLEKFRQASMTDQEKAVAAAREEGAKEARTAALREIGGRLVTTELRAALAGRMDDKQRDALLESVDGSRFLTDDGDVNTKDIAAWADRVAPARAPSFDGGARGGPAKANNMNDILRRAAGRS